MAGAALRMSNLDKVRFRQRKSARAFYLCVKLKKMLPESHRGLGMN